MNERIGVQYGLRYSLFDYVGKGTAYTFDELGNKTSETKYAKGKPLNIMVD